MTRFAAAISAGLVLAAWSGLARADVLTTPGYSERDTPADLPSSDGGRKLDILIDVQAQSPNQQTGQTGQQGSGSGQGTRPLPQRWRSRSH